MDLLEACLDNFHVLFTFITASFRGAKDIMSSVLALNYDVVSNLFYFSNKVLWTIEAIVSTFISIICIFLTAVVCVYGFITDVFAIVVSCFILIGEFFILLYNLMDLIFHGIENIIIFITTGGQWTTERVKMSASDLIDSWNNLLSYGNIILNLFLGGFTQIGNFVSSIVAGVLAASKYTVSSCCFLADYCLVSIADMVERVINRVYYVLTVYIPNLSKETYLGVIICCVVYLLILNVVAYLQRRGMTFPLFRSSASEIVESEDSDIDFSDGEFESNSTNGSENTVVSDSETENGVLDEDTSGSEDGGLDEDPSISDYDTDIDIQLPHPSLGRYIFRPATPASKQRLSPEEYEKQIEKEREKRKCVVCQDKKKSVLIMPCRHMCMCVECGNQIARARQTERRICPLCRGKIQTIIDVFV